MTATYRAIMITRPGGVEVLAEVDLPVTEPGPGELRVRVRACGVGATDLTMLRGKYAFAPKLPIVGGYEIDRLEGERQCGLIDNANCA